MSRASRKKSREGYDLFGYDPAFDEKTASFMQQLTSRWLEVRALGMDTLPSDGRCILVSNHGGALPWDALVLREVLRQNGRILRPLLEDTVMTAPFLGSTMSRMGCVRASQENATRLLDDEEAIAVFPEGKLGLGKRFFHRGKLMRFGRGGFIRLALKAKAPLIPVAIVGAEHSAPLLSKWKLLIRETGMDYLPITPTFPFLGPLGLLPLPARWTLQVLPAIDPRKEVDDENDAMGISRLAARIRTELQDAVQEIQEARPPSPLARAKRLLPGRRKSKRDPELPEPELPESELLESELPEPELLEPELRGSASKSKGARHE
ncbi:MAG: acyltransferase family protein [Deltaproteobacteria bacterium]|nr:acyltransferase family protein [Deltaproteobacteria bacterium]